MRKLKLNYRQRQILKSAVLQWWNEWQPNTIDAIMGALSKAGIGMSTELVRAYEKSRVEYEEQMSRWVNRILIAAGVMPRDLWCVGTPATDNQTKAIADELGIEAFPLVTDSQADVILGALKQLRPKRVGKWLTIKEAEGIAKTCDLVDKKCTALKGQQ